jgi:hypothetical protein
MSLTWAAAHRLQLSQEEASVLPLRWTNPILMRLQASAVGTAFHLRDECLVPVKICSSSFS